MVFWILTVGYAALMLVQWLLVRRFVAYLNPNPTKADAKLVDPDVAIVLCARGADPHLGDCLKSLASQDWPRYHVFVVTDHADDPALVAIQSAIASAVSNRIEHLVAAEHDPRRSLKCNSLVHACERIDSQFDVVALIDADVVPEPNWLRRLIQPLNDASVGATFGTRWYQPNSNRLGTNVRGLWNAAAIVQMQAYTIPWGGSLAIRRSALLECGVLESWKSSLFEDVAVGPQLARHGLQTRLCPDLVLQSDEEATVSTAYWWMTRQLLDARLYHPRWPLVLLHALATGDLPLATILAAVICMIQGNMFLAAALLGLLIGAEILNAGLLLQIESAVGGVRESSPSGFSKVNRRMRTATWWLALPVTQVLHMAAALHAAVLRQVTWRGVTYRFRHGRSLQMVAYVPMRAIANATSPKAPKESVE